MAAPRAGYPRIRAPATGSGVRRNSTRTRRRRGCRHPAEKLYNSTLVNGGISCRHRVLDFRRPSAGPCCRVRWACSSLVVRPKPRRPGSPSRRRWRRRNQNRRSPMPAGGRWRRSRPTGSSPTSGCSERTSSRGAGRRARVIARRSSTWQSSSRQRVFGRRRPAAAGCRSLISSASIRSCRTPGRSRPTATATNSGAGTTSSRPAACRSNGRRWKTRRSYSSATASRRPNTTGTTSRAGTCPARSC